MADQLLHHLGMHAVHGEQGEIGVAELVEGEAFEPELGAVVGPPRAERSRVDTGSPPGGNGRKDLVYLYVTLLGMAERVGALKLLLLGFAELEQRFAHVVGQRQQAHAGFGLGLLEVAVHVIRVADVHDAALEVDVLPRQAADLATSQVHGDGDEVGHVAGVRLVEHGNHDVNRIRTYGLLGLGVHLGRVGLEAWVLYRAAHRVPWGGRSSQIEGREVHQGLLLGGVVRGA